MDFLTKLLEEAGRNPLATIIVICMLAAFMFWLIRIYPKSREEHRALVKHIASSNEVMRHSSSVIENNSRVIENNTKMMEIQKQSLDHLGGSVNAMGETLEDVREKFIELRAELRSK